MLKSKGIIGRGDDQLPTSGYLVVLGLFVGMIVLCFIWGVWEYKKPKDPGPLFIDLDRIIDERSEEHARRASKATAFEPPARSRKVIKAAELSETTRNPHIDETIRVRGNVRISKGEVIPYNMIVEGNLTSQDDVTFQGGLHIKGRAIIGTRNRIEKSIVCQEELVLLEDVIVYNCVDCEGLVFIKKGVRVGVGVEGGGIASARTICLEKAAGPLMIYYREVVRIVGSLREVIPEDLKQIIEVKAT
jgi:hypothetical protein